MSLYNMLNGVSPVTFYVLPMLGHHPDEYPRFRDCFLADEEHPEHDGRIMVYTRTGGGNREEYEVENEWMRSLGGFVTDYDDSFDCTYASWVFEIPEQWKADFDLIMEGKIKEVSGDYQKELKRVYPKLEKEFNAIFNGQE